MVEQTYISAQEAETRIVAMYRKEHGAFADTFNTAIDACQTVILDMYDNAPKDVIAVVRCRECKYHLPETERTNPYCNKFHCMKPDDWFCADGERKVQDADK